jgi:PAS domain S-box-containing protein
VPLINHHKKPVWIFVLTAIATMGVLLGLRCYTDYKREVSLLEERLMSQARVIDENLNANLSAISLILENIKQEATNNPTHHNNQLNNYLKMQCNLIPGIRTILIIDSHGRCIYSNRDELIRQDFSNRDYFKTPRDASDKNQIFLSAPFVSILDKLIINIVKPITGKQGEFEGVVSVSLEREYFQTLLKSTIYSPDNRIGLVHSDGISFVAIPDLNNSIAGQNLLKPGTQFFRHIQGGKPTSVQSGRSKTTGDNRMFTYITNSPKELRFDKHLIVAASRNLDDVLLPWKIDTGIQLTVYILLSSITIFVTNKTHQRGVELALLHATQTAILDSAGEGILGVDLSETILFSNRTAELLTGRNKVKGLHFHQLFHNDISGHDTKHCPIQLTLKDGVSRSALDCVLSNQISAEYTVTPLIQGNEIVGSVIVFRDVTAKRKIELDLRQALENTTASNLTMNRLMNIVAHEFRTPLSLLTSSTDILDRYGERLSKKQLTEQNGYIRSAARQMSSLIDSILSFNRLKMDKPNNRSELLDIGRICRTIAAEVSTVWGTGHVFHVEIDSDCGTSFLDVTLFRRVIENLLTNAFRYTPTGGTVSFNVNRDRNRLLIMIADSGIGIPEKDQLLIFDAFYRCLNVETRRGLGLGLSIVHEALTNMDGTIAVESAIGKGTTMRVEIPVVDHSYQ